jgi:RimJ/RimL family protein N-acetyltransferase
MVETGRLLVRRLTRADLDALHAVCGDPEVMRYVGNNRPLTRDQTLEWIERSLRNYGERGYGCGAVIERTDGRLLGFCGLVHTPGCRDAELIYGLAKEHWGRGLASEAAKGMLDYGFRTLGFLRIEATIDPENHASIRIARKLGMVFERSGLDEHQLPTVFYAIERSQWEEVR